MSADASNAGAAAPARAGDADKPARMRASWERNAAAWTDAVREQRIASRRAGTDAAVVDAVLRLAPSRVLDVGCGEGWLARVLAERGVAVVGIDASEALVESARALGGGRFEKLAYADIGADAFGALFDLAVCNFALLEDDLAPALDAIARTLGANGRLVVQTVHPWAACGDARYENGWRLETFAAFGNGFVAPMPWYFRTLGAWIDALAASGFRVERAEEPIDRESGKPLSLLLTAVRAEADR
ncbi:MAG: class I SAM-dependent methyltransferase [Rhodanobacteraceae bacterium]